MGNDHNTVTLPLGHNVSQGEEECPLMLVEKKEEFGSVVEEE